jgi:hypothetical protein
MGSAGHGDRGVWVKLLVIGGTRFVGRAFVELAVQAEEKWRPRAPGCTVAGHRRP